MDHRQASIARNLQAFAATRGADISDVVSVKFRPVAAIEGFADRYVYPDEYQALREAFGFKPVASSDYSGGTSLTRGDVDLVEHETGPEILTMISGAGIAVAPFVDFATAATMLAGVAVWLRNRVKRNSDTASPERYYHDAKYIKVERRQIGRDGDLVEETITYLEFSNPVDDVTIAREIERRLKGRS